MNADAGAAELRAVMRAGEPWRNQLALFEINEPTLDEVGSAKITLTYARVG